MPRKKHGGRGGHQGEPSNAPASAPVAGAPAAATAPPEPIAAFDGPADTPSAQNTPSSRRGGPLPIEYSVLGDLRNLSDFLGMAGWACARGSELPDSFPSRPAKLNSLGRSINVTLNSFNVEGMPEPKVYQYHISIRGGGERQGLMKKLWASEPIQKILGGKKNLWLYDGNHLAWSTTELEKREMRVDVDLDQEENREIKPGKEGKNKHSVYIVTTRKVDFAELYAFMRGTGAWSSNCIDTINFFDHVMREHPSQNLTRIKKSFFQRGEVRFDLGYGLEAFKGVYSSLRPVLNDRGERGLSVNVDVANGTFWKTQSLGKAILQSFGDSEIKDLQNKFSYAKDEWYRSNLRNDLRRFKRLPVVTNHRPVALQYVIDDFIGTDCYQYRFNQMKRDNNGNELGEESVTIFEYYLKTYRKSCIGGVPLVKVTKKIKGENIIFPIDVLQVPTNQRYNAKLNDRQTAEMIKFAVTVPKDRWASVMNGVRLLNWSGDPYLRHYGIRINPKPSTVKARVLPVPVPTFADNKSVTARDATQGRWRIDKMRFVERNRQVLESWGVCIIDYGRGVPTRRESVDAFFDRFMEIYRGHGGNISTNTVLKGRPNIMKVQINRGGEIVADIFNGTGNLLKKRPQILFFIVTDKNTEVYRRLKKSCDCRFGVPSQVLQSRHVATGSPQYISNVCMKVNAKLGGATCFAKGILPKLIKPLASGQPLMVVGIDVSHPAPGAASGDAASICAITVSADRAYMRYMAQVNTNGSRVEMVTTSNIRDHFGDMVKRWMANVGGNRGPEQVLYIRDGVSEGQYLQVLENEVIDMKAVLRDKDPKSKAVFTTVIAGKRHHIRFFPEHASGDRNGNPLPGTLVETGCTHPYEWDFYLCSHVAIKGTARPIHYQVIQDEAKWSPEALQQFLFEHSFQYVRSTTPVSLFPAVYYAHLAADRARAHLNVHPVSSGKKETKKEIEAKKAKKEQQQKSASSTGRDVEVAALIPFPPKTEMRDTMWFV